MDIITATLRVYLGGRLMLEGKYSSFWNSNGLICTTFLCCRRYKRGLLTPNFYKMWHKCH